MWGFLPATTSPYPKQGPLLKGGCKASFHMMGAHFLPQLPGKQFPDFINRKNVGAPPRIITSAPEKMETEEHSSPENREAPKTTPIVNNKACNKKKRKKSRRRRRKNKTCTPQMGTTTTSLPRMPSRRQTLSCSSTESDDFVIFFQDDSESTSDSIETEQTECYSSIDSIVPHKKVRFADDDKLCEVHQMVMWSYAYQSARKGPWEEYARDRARFKRRVVNIETIIGHVFTGEHRSRIYEQRFATDDDK
ncbi:hypothetical protein GEV33_005885 [Tenebrio molitor]|uniref:Protein DP71L n=2 Tax=Tenebrio molitor TaxID=7067 RepID=A0A8J6LEJ0_TENMO|nr:hypothetical protein GEV33_005885 [Tenebrio molitor]